MAFKQEFGTQSSADFPSDRYPPLICSSQYYSNHQLFDLMKKWFHEEDKERKKQLNNEVHSILDEIRKQNDTINFLFDYYDADYEDLFYFAEWMKGNKFAIQYKTTVSFSFQKYLS